MVLLESAMKRASCPHWRISSSFAFKLSFKIKYFFLMLTFQIFIKILVFLKQSFLLNFSISHTFIQHSFVSFSQISQFYTLFSPKCCKSCFNSFVSFVQPRSFFTFFHLENLLLNFMSFCKALLYKFYFFCLTICSSIFLRFSNSELYLTLGEY